MDFHIFEQLERECPRIIIDALHSFPDIIERTQEKLRTIGPGYWYFYVNKEFITAANMLEYMSLTLDSNLDEYLSRTYDIHNINKWIYLPIHTGPLSIRSAIEENDLSSTVFAATSGYSPDELTNRNIRKLYKFLWGLEQYS